MNKEKAGNIYIFFNNSENDFKTAISNAFKEFSKDYDKNIDNPSELR